MGIERRIGELGVLREAAKNTRSALKYLLTVKYVPFALPWHKFGTNFEPNRDVGSNKQALSKPEKWSNKRARL